MRTITVLVIDDDPNIRKLLTDLLSARAGIRLLVAGDGKEAVRYFIEEKVDVVLTDIHMPGFTGPELVADMQKVKMNPEILVMTANATPENVENARRIGARSVIIKPFDDLSVVEAEIDKAVKAAVARGGGAGAAPAPPAAPARQPAHREAAPPRPAPAARPAARATPPPIPPPAEDQTPVFRAAASKHAAVPVGGDPAAGDDSWSASLTGNETPPAPGPRMAAAPRAPAVPRPPAAAARPAPDPPPSPPPPGEFSFEDLREAGRIEVDAPPPAAAGRAEAAPPVPAELEEIFQVEARLDVGRMKMQVPIVCLQTWEEKGAIQALRRLAAVVQREFYTWSASKGVMKDDEQPMGEMYRDPARALEFIRRQKGRGLYLLADFRACLEDRTVVRLLREMVMDLQTAHTMLVLTAPRLPVPPELGPLCVSFDWPRSEGQDLNALLDEVRQEVAATTGQPARLDPAARESLLEKVREMPAARARFEIARVLMALHKRAS